MADEFFASAQEAVTLAEMQAAALDATFGVAAFRAQFPIFNNAALYTNTQVSFYLGLAYKMLIPDRWGNMLDEGAALFAAHFLALDRIAASTNGQGIPGAAIGVLSSASVDKVSYSRDVSSVMEDGAGHWNMTVYGLQYIRFARMMGTGPLHVGTGTDRPGLSASLYAGGQGAWPGVMPGYF